MPHISNPPRISAVIAVKDRCDYLLQALRSLQEQTIEDWECIVVDDHSTEDIAKVIQELNDPRITLIKNTNEPGIANARNIGNASATAKWIAVVDSDDINLPQRFERTLAVLDAHPEAQVFYSSMLSFGAEKNFKYWSSYSEYDRELIYERDFIPHPTATYLRSTVQEIGYDPTFPRCVDYDLWLSLADRNILFCSSSEALVLYRIHETQTPKILPGIVNGIRIVELIWEKHQKIKQAIPA